MYHCYSIATYVCMSILLNECLNKFRTSFYDCDPCWCRYRWAFIGGAAAGEAEEEEEVVPEKGRQKKDAPRRQTRHTRFNPHIIRLARLLNMKVNLSVVMGLVFTAMF